MRYSIILSCLSLLVVLSTKSQKNYTLEEFLKTPDQELIQHKRELDRLIQQRKLNIPQSQAMLFYPDPIENQKILKNELTDWKLFQSDFTQPRKVSSKETTNLLLNANKALNNAMTAENKANAQGHLVLYHATQPNLYAQSYINTQLQKLALELKGKKIDTETLLMRDLNTQRLYEKEKKIRKYLLKKDPLISDIMPTNAKYLISTNPAISGNISNPFEATLYFFLQNYNANKDVDLPILLPKGNTLLEKVTKAHNDELSKLSKEFNDKSDAGVLLQFIVKDDNLGRKILYTSKPGGFHRHLEPFEETVDPVDILKTIRTNPDDVESLESQQMRLIITGDKLLDLENPAMKEFDVKAYSGSDQSLKEFQQKVDAAVQKIRTNYLTQKQQMSWPKRIQYGARDLFYKRQSPWEQRQQYKRMLSGDIGSPFE